MTKLNIEEIEAKITNLYKQLGEYSQAIIKLLSEQESKHMQYIKRITQKKAKNYGWKPLNQKLQLWQKSI